MRVLTLNDCGVQDEQVATIAMNMPHIEELDLKNSEAYRFGFPNRIIFRESKQ